MTFFDIVGKAMSTYWEISLENHADSICKKNIIVSIGVNEPVDTVSIRRAKSSVWVMYPPRPFEWTLQSFKWKKFQFQGKLIYLFLWLLSISSKRVD